MIDALPLLLGPEGYQISRSVRLRSSASAYFNRTPASAGNRKTWTWSGWVKRGAINSSGYYSLFSAGTTSPTYDGFRFGLDSLQFFQAGGNTSNLVTTSVYRDASAWYHVVLAVDTTQATSSNRVKIYVNGVQTTSFSTANYPSLNTEASINNTLVHNVGAQQETSASFHFDGYLTEINFIDGQALTPSSFGETDAVTGVWKPKKYTGTYGTNGFYLNFSDNSAATAAAIGKDYSGNGNNWTPNNISLTAGATYDSMLDVPTPWADGGNGRGNYAVLNPLSLGSTVTLSNANLTMTEVGTYATTVSSIAMTSGKWYAEMTVGSNTFAGTIGIAKLGYASTSRLGFQANTWSYNNDGGLYYNSNTLAVVSSYTTNDVIGIAFDADNLTITFYKNNVQQGTQYTAANSGLTAGEFYFATGHINSTSNWNFGQRPFAYTPPSGFKALNTLNLPVPTILKGNLYFDVLTWSGSGGSSRALTGLAFQPDFVWGKVRNTTYGHMLFDAVRGAGSLKELGTNVTGAEGYASSNQYGYLSAFNSDGFTVTAGTDGTIPNAYWNQSGNTYVSWQWKEGATQGFDIVTYTGTGSLRTVNHSLGVAPRMMIIKGRDGTANNWGVYHASVGNTASLFLNLTNAQDVGSAYWNNTTPTSTQFTLNTGSSTNSNGVNYVAYLFSEVAGFSRFGSYTGNGSTDGPFVFCGFRPRFVMIKGSSFTSNWFIQDGARNGYNVNTGVALRPNLSNAEDGTTFYDMDLLSNGFKLRTSTGDSNSSGATFIFAAFAENPFKNSLAR